MVSHLRRVELYFREVSPIVDHALLAVFGISAILSATTVSGLLSIILLIAGFTILLTVPYSVVTNDPGFGNNPNAGFLRLLAGIGIIVYMMATFYSFL